MFTNTPVNVPIAIRSHTKLGAGFEKRVRTQLARRIGPTMLVERATVRFEDANGPKGGVDTICRIKLVVSGRSSIVVEKRATSEPLAFAEAVHAIGTSLTRASQKRQVRATRGRARAARAAAPKPPAVKAERPARPAAKASARPKSRIKASGTKQRAVTAAATTRPSTRAARRG